MSNARGRGRWSEKRPHRVCRGGRHALLLTCLLLAGDGLLRTLAGARVGLGALSVDGQAAAVADALVASDLDLAADVGGDLAAQVALDLEVGVDVLTQLDELVVAEVTGAEVGADAGGVESLLGAGASDAVDVGERDLHALLAREVDAGKTCHTGGSPRVTSEGLERIRPVLPGNVSQSRPRPS